jgi:hypothetical protein
MRRRRRQPRCHCCSRRTAPGHGGRGHAPMLIRTSSSREIRLQTVVGRALGVGSAPYAQEWRKHSDTKSLASDSEMGSRNRIDTSPCIHATFLFDVLSF